MAIAAPLVAVASATAARLIVPVELLPIDAFAAPAGLLAYCAIPLSIVADAEAMVPLASAAARMVSAAELVSMSEATPMAA